MKNIKYYILKLFISLLFISISIIGFSQPPPPPGGSSGSGDGTGGSESSRTGGGAPLGSGVFILLSLGVAYGARKLYIINKEELEE